MSRKHAAALIDKMPPSPIFTRLDRNDIELLVNRIVQDNPEVL